MRETIVVIVLLAAILSGCFGQTQQVEPPALEGSGGFSQQHVFPGAYDMNGSFSRVLHDGPYEVRPPKEYRLASDEDGVDIQIYVEAPDVPEGHRVPVVAMASPYYGGFDWDNAPRLNRFSDNLVPHGYAMAYIAVRGTSDSGGCNDFYGPLEAADVDQAVTWLGEQPWSSGDVGMIGLSYGAITAWEVAAQANPHLRTIVPVEGLPDLFTLLWGNGTWKTGSAIGLQGNYYGYSLDLAASGDRSLENALQGALCPGLAEGLVGSVASTTTQQSNPFGYWAERDYRQRILEHYQGSVLFVHGLQDWQINPGTMYPFIHELETQGVVVKHLLGQWGHTWPDSLSHRAPEPRWDWSQILLHWFDYWLKNETSTDLGPRVQVQDNELQWRSGTAWPPEGARTTVFYIEPDGRLDRSTSSVTGRVFATTNVVVPDPDHLDENTTVQWWTHPMASACPECPTFTTPPLDDDLRFAGLPRVPVTVTPHGPGGQLTAYLYDIDPDGEMTRLGWGAIDLRFADGGREPQPVQTGEPMLVKLQLEPLDVIVREGSRLVLQLHQGGEGDHNAPARTPFPMSIEVGDGQSRLVVQVIEPDEANFFEPPGVGP